jgi:hypothetical protein
MTDEVKMLLRRFFLSANTYDRTTQHEESYRREHVKHEGSYRSSLHLCDELRQLHISYISRYSYLNISCCNIIFSRISQLYKCLTLKQLIAAMSVNWHSKWCLSDSLRFEEKRVKFRPWLQQIVAKLNVNMFNNNVSVQFWYLHSWLEGLTLSQVTPWIVACIKSNKVLNHMIIEKLINQLQHVYNDSESKKRATCILKALKQKKTIC